METQVTNQYGYIREGKVYLRGYLHYPDRAIGDVKISEEATFAYFTQRYALAEQKVDELHQFIEEAQNKGSYLMKLIHLREHLAEFAGLGDFPALLRRLDETEVTLRAIIVVNRAKNLEIKRALIADAQADAESTDWQVTTDRMKELKEKWIKTGAADKEFDEALDTEFNAVVDSFFDRRKVYYDEQNVLIKERVARYDTLVERAKALYQEANVDAGFATLKKLQEEWKTVGKVPIKRSAVLWKKFKRANDSFYERYKKAKGITTPTVRRLDPKIEAQMKMAEEAEKLAALKDTEMEKAAERGKQLLNEWKNLGRPKQPDQRLADRFRLACDKIFELNYLMRVVRRKHHFYDQKRFEDQMRIKIELMSDLARKDKTELATFESYAMASVGTGQPLDRESSSKISIQRRKIGVKEQIVAELIDKMKAGPN